MDARRRFFLKGHVSSAGARNAPRPPWAIDEGAFVECCTRCGDCVRGCPELILRAGDGGYPIVSFDERGCTECAVCADTCAAGALRREPDTKPWTWRPLIGDSCLAKRKVECRVCGESCEHGAIRFRPALGAVSQPHVDDEICTGCGACLAPCPTHAISFANAADR